MVTDENAADATRHGVLDEFVVGSITGEFVVPGYQRGFRWGDEQVLQLLDDINDSSGKYYLQPIVVKPSGIGWELIDGQQRLTTLYLIFGYLRTRLPWVEPNYSLRYATRPNSAAYLREPMGDRSGENIDYFFLHQAAEQIRAWFESQPDPNLAAINFYQALGDRVYVIWYEAPADLDSRTLFTRLNVGKIPLTDAELVKAVLLSRIDQPEEVAAQWDNIERDLRAPELWAFATGKAETWPTHITLLLDTLARRVDATGAGAHHTFEALRARIAASAEAARAVWEEVVDLHSVLRSWYDDSDLFHKIGYLVLNQVPLATLFDPALDMTRTGFEASLDERIRKILKLTRAQLSDLNYDDHAASCGRVLVLSNVETVRFRNEALGSSPMGGDPLGPLSFERYSFAAHVRQTWSLEHIHAQSAVGLDEVRQWTKWLELHREALLTLSDVPEQKRMVLLALIDAALPTINKDSFFKLEQDVIDVFTDPETDADGVHSLSNLALLAGGDNSALNNSGFAVKRRAILELDRAGSFIPPATRNVFLKYYTHSEAQQIHFWGIHDRAAYSAELVRLLEPYLQPETVDA